MTPREKADKLVDLFNKTIGLSEGYKAEEQAKECALICCNEVLGHMGADRGYMFWLEVKQEIEKCINE
jgi:hypothetical protein